MSTRPICPYCGKEMQKADYIAPLCEEHMAAMRRAEPIDRVQTLD